MAALLEFYADGNNIRNLNGSGLGGYGASFGASVAVGSYQDSTFITSSAGTSNGGQVDNVKFLNNGSGVLNGVSPVSGYNIRNISYKNATLNIRFTNDTAVNTQNTKIYFYDRNSVLSAQSGVVVKCAEIRNPYPTSPSPSPGSGSALWVQFDSTTGGSGLALQDSPGPTGMLFGSNVRHDWYTIMSFSPSTIGSKLFAAFVTTEYYGFFGALILTKLFYDIC